MCDKRKPAGFSSRIRGRAQHLQPSLQFSSWRSPRCSARSVRSPLLRISAPFSSALCFFALRPCLSSQSLGSSSAVLLFFSAFPLFFPRVPFPAAHFPFASALAPPLCGLPFACRSQCLAVPLCDSLHRNSAPALSLGGFSCAPSQRFPLAVSLALRPSASFWRFLSRFAPALFFSRTSSRTYACVEIFFKNPFRDF